MKINYLWYSRMRMGNLPPVSISIAKIQKKKHFLTQKFDTDYERGMTVAIEIDLPDTYHLGCHFHFSQAIFPKVGATA